MGKLRNPLAAAAEWAERMSNPESQRERKQTAPVEAESESAAPVEPPVPEAEEYAPLVDKPESTPEAVMRIVRSGDERRSSLWAGCIMLGVACSVLAFIIGMMR